MAAERGQAPPIAGKRLPPGRAGCVRPRASLGQLTLLHHQRPRLAAPLPFLRLALECRAQGGPRLSEVRSKSRVRVRVRVGVEARVRVRVRVRDRGKPHLLQLMTDLPHSCQLSSLGSLHPADRLDPVRVQRSKVGGGGKAAGDTLRLLHCPHFYNCRNRWSVSG
jgi:hypothetical protein